MLAADLSFACPACRGPLIVELVHAGRRTDCPHCYTEITIPAESESVNKEAFIEPTGLRRLLMEVRDREWELLRRKLRTAHARIRELEATAEGESEVESLRAQLATADATIAELRRELGESRAQVEAIDSERQVLSAALETERAKVFLMEAAGAPELSQIAESGTVSEYSIVAELQLQMAELRKENETLRRSKLAREVLAPAGAGARSSLSLDAATNSAAEVIRGRCFVEPARQS